MFFSFLFGYYILNFYLSKKKNEVVDYKNKAFQVESSTLTTNITIIVFLLILLFVIGLIQFRGLPPIVSIFREWIVGNLNQGEIVDYKDSRLLITKSHYFGGEYTGQGFLRTISKFGWTICVVFSFSNWVFFKKRLWLMLLFVAVVGSIVFVAGDGTRAPITRVLLTLVIAYTLCYKVSIRKLLFFVAFLLILLIGLSLISSKLYFITSADDNILISAFENIILRIFTGNQINDVLVIDYFSQGILKHFYGQQHLTQIINSLPGVSGLDSFSLVLARLYKAGNTTTYMSPTYLAIAYADFGYLGSVIVYFILGIFLAISEYFAFGSKKNLISFTFVCISILELGFTALSGIIKLLPSIVVLTLFYTFIRIISIVRIRNKNTRELPTSRYIKNV